MDVNGNIRSRGVMLIDGSDLKLGLNDGRNQGSNLLNRAMVHGWNDELKLNFNSDFEGGVVVNTSSGSQHAISLNNITTGKTDFLVYGDGRVRARELILTNANPFPDYVFEKEYDLMPLQNLKTFIQNNKHLPSIPNASKVEAEGINISDFQEILLKKIEELTLYLIQQDEKIHELETTLSQKK